MSLAPDQPSYRVLIVEDHWENQQILVKLLQPLGFDVQVANNGLEGVVLWERWHPHVILMDMRMPVMSGYEATQQIRAKARLVNRSIEDCDTPAPPDQPFVTKIIAVTSSAFNEDRSAILAIGCDDFISKPFRAEEVFAKLAQHLGVQYLYAAKDEISVRNEQKNFDSPWFRPLKVGCVLEASSFQGMPAEWIVQLHSMAVLGKDNQLLKLVEQIPETHANLSQILRELISDFRFEEIVELTKPVDHE